MKNRTIFRLLILLSFSLFLSVAASAQTSDCDTTTDAQIVTEIMGKIKLKYASQMTHINVRSSDRVVTVEGWVTTKKIKGEIDKIVKKAKCVKTKDVKNILTIGVGGGCGPGTKACGTICIPKGETCNIGNLETARVP